MATASTKETVAQCSGNDNTIQTGEDNTIQTGEDNTIQTGEDNTIQTGELVRDRSVIPHAGLITEDART
jgi:hypothetical protein